jgi:putative spermidine/putrescine transport system permease protein
MSAELGLPIRHRSRLWLYAVGGLIPMSFSDATLLQFPPEKWSLRWYEAYFGSVEWRDATMISVKVAVLTTLVATPIGVAAAYALNAGGLRFGRAITLLLTVALIIPVILVGIGTFFLYAKLGLNNTITGLVIAHTVQALPLVVITVLPGLRSYDMNQERVARSLGANRFTAFWQVTRPQIQFSIVSGGLFAFITSFDELTIALFVTSGLATTLPKQMWDEALFKVTPTLAAVSALLLVSVTALILLAETLRRRTLG